MRLPDLSPRAYRRLTLVALLLLATIIVTGAAVRLSGSGLGCHDWPNCAPGELIGTSNANQLIEQLNRLFTGLVCIGVIAAVLGSRRRIPRRPDLTTLSWILVGGVLFQAVLGGIVVKAKLSILTVMGHFLVSIVLVGVALVLHHRAAQPEKPARMVPVVAGSTRVLARAVYVLTVWVLIAGTIVTAAGPHGGDATAKRLAWPIPDAARLHGASVDVLLVCVLLLALMLWRDRAPHRVLTVVSVYLVLGCAQAVLGYVQYFDAIPPLLVGFHVAGAVLVFSAATQLQLELTVPAPVAATRQSPAAPPVPAGVAPRGIRSAPPTETAPA